MIGRAKVEGQGAKVGAFKTFAPWPSAFA